MCFVVYKENISAYVEKRQQNRQGTYKLTLGRVRATIAALEKN